MYQEIIDYAIQEANDLRQEDRGSDAGEWHPSSLSGCARAAVYDYLGTEESDPTSIRSIRIMQRGTEMHEYVQGLVPSLEAEVDVDYAGINGSCDGLLPVGEDENGIIWEVQEYKSIGSTGVKFMHPKPFGKRGPGNLPQPKPEHVKQARIYHGALRAMGKNLSNIIRIVYFNRDDWEVLEFEVPAWTDDEWHEFLAEIADLEEHAESGTLPPRLPERDKFPCSYCNYRTTCWENE